MVVVFHFSFPYLWASRLDFTPCGVKPVRRGCAGLVHDSPYLGGASAREDQCYFLRHAGPFSYLYTLRRSGNHSALSGYGGVCSAM